MIVTSASINWFRLWNKLVNNLGSIETKLQDKSDVNVVMQVDTRIKRLEEHFIRLEQNVESRMAAADGILAQKS